MSMKKRNLKTCQPVTAPARREPDPAPVTPPASPRPPSRSRQSTPPESDLLTASQVCRALSISRSTFTRLESSLGGTLLGRVQIGGPRCIRYHWPTLSARFYGEAVPYPSTSPSPVYPLARLSLALASDNPAPSLIARRTLDLYLQERGAAETVEILRHLFEQWEGIIHPSRVKGAQTL